MFSLLVNTYCNGGCPYCFAQSAMDGQELDVRNLDLLISFYKKFHQKVAGLFGGEPTLHPQVVDIINTFNGNSTVEFVLADIQFE